MGVIWCKLHERVSLMYFFLLLIFNRHINKLFVRLKSAMHGFELGSKLTYYSFCWGLFGSYVGDEIYKLNETYLRRKEGEVKL